MAGLPWQHGGAFFADNTKNKNNFTDWAYSMLVTMNTQSTLLMALIINRQGA
jgi:hypothetical protein